MRLSIEELKVIVESLRKLQRDETVKKIPNWYNKIDEVIEIIYELI